MVKVGPKPNYLSEKGYLCYASFVDACEDCNPLTVRAVFDAMSTGDNVSPDVAQAALDSFASDTGEFKKALLRTKVSGSETHAFLSASPIPYKQPHIETTIRPESCPVSAALRFFSSS